MDCTENIQENEDYKIADTKSKQLRALLGAIFESAAPNPDAEPLRELALELSVDIVYAIQRLT